MRWKRTFEGLDTLVAERGNALLATAVLLTSSRAAAEDLLQAALERLMRNWSKVQGDPEGYLRRTLYHLAIDQWRSRRRRPEVLSDVEPPGQADATEAVSLRHALRQALSTLPPRQRAVLVLRRSTRRRPLDTSTRSGPAPRSCTWNAWSTVPGSSARPVRRAGSRIRAVSTGWRTTAT